MDDAAEMLMDYGFINPEKRNDLNYVRDYLRQWMSSDKPKAKKTYIKYWDEDEIDKIKAGFEDMPEYDDEGRLLFPESS